MKKLIILLVILVLSMIMAVISSCTTTKYVPMKEVVRDTVYRQSDSIIRYRWITNTKAATYQRLARTARDTTPTV